MDVTIRKAVISDYESLCEIYVEIDEQHRINHPELFIKPDEYARAKEYIQEMINDSNKALFVADVDSKVVAFAECYIQQSSNFPVIKKREWVQLDGIAVKKEYQNRHIGSLLLEKITEWANSKDIQRIELKVYSFNKNAEDFYSEKGFQVLSKVMYMDL
ncbi:MAG TPA: GNAT family N-acetyltransferase [Desulfosporosinus sp.]|nr:GNAT family N-acetyltransferase [Desulfosporosinus sp.]